MDIGKVPLLEVIRKRMGWLTQRQTVLSQNIANANTPGYAPRDLKEPDFAELARAYAHKVPLATTQGNHLTAGGGLGGGGLGGDRPYRVEVDRDGGQATMDGNRVVLEDEMMKVAETASSYQLATNLYKKHISMIKTALGRK